MCDILNVRCALRATEKQFTVWSYCIKCFHLGWAFLSLFAKVICTGIRNIVLDNVSLSQIELFAAVAKSCQSLITVSRCFTLNVAGFLDPPVNHTGNAFHSGYFWKFKKFFLVNVHKSYLLSSWSPDSLTSPKDVFDGKPDGRKKYILRSVGR